MTRKKKVQLWLDVTSYMLVGLGGFSFVMNSPNMAYAITLVAGAVNKFGPRMFGITEATQ